jgi:hypothetical protein
MADCSVGSRHVENGICKDIEDTGRKGKHVRKDDARERGAEPTPTNGCVGQRPEAQWKAGVPVGS